MPGLTDAPVSGFGHPIQRYQLQQDPPYKSSSRNQYCIDWWKANLPNGASGRSGGGVNSRLQIALRGVSKADATALRAVVPVEEDQPVSQTGFTDEKSQLEKYGTHHQKPILIDYDWDSGRKAVGYVMGLNSVTDYWDRTAHEVDDPKREVLSDKQISDELDRELSTQQAPNSITTKLYQNVKNSFSKPEVPHGEGHEHYVHGRPYQDYACRIQGPALAQLHFNFENGWADALGQNIPYQLPPAPPPNIPKVAGNRLILSRSCARRRVRKRNPLRKSIFRQLAALATISTSKTSTFFTQSLYGI